MVLLLGACEGAHDPVEPVRFGLASLESPPEESVERWSCYDPVDPHCQNELPSDDPNPTAPGYYLGSEYSFSACTTENGINDSDHDGLDDFCEYQLALAFRPELMMSPYETALGREEYWAAGTIGSSVVVIVYMFGYYQDNGAPGCQTGILGQGICGMHWGDNEFVNVYLEFDSTTQHWKLFGQFFSAHWSTPPCADLLYCDSSKWYFRNSLRFPDKADGYAEVWVSRSKHANYPKQSSCNGGGPGGYDDCNGNISYGRFAVHPLRNVGSQSHPFINYTTSINNPYTRPGPEWFWEDIPFCGWSVDSGSRVSCAPTSYKDVLTAFLNNVPY